MTEYIVRAQDLESGLIICGTHVQGEIVRCRDCKHNEYGICSVLSHDLVGRYDCPHMSRDWYVSPDDYCSWGKRRES